MPPDIQRSIVEPANVFDKIQAHSFCFQCPIEILHHFAMADFQFPRQLPHRFAIALHVSNRFEFELLDIGLLLPEHTCLLR
jgi:hypothetical protein